MSFDEIYEWLLASSNSSVVLLGDYWYKDWCRRNRALFEREGYSDLQRAIRSCETRVARLVRSSRAERA